jgi:iron complex transport system ATP-binding protein
MRLSAHDLAYGYPARTLGRDIDLAVESGEVLCLLGPNGSGKTTLFKTLLGLLPVHAGRVCLGGDDIAAWSRARIARTIGYVPQQHEAYFPFTVREVVLMGRSPHVSLFSSPSRHDEAVAGAALAELGLSALADSAYTRISGGERQLTLVARALAQEPSVLVMDEPTASLDFGNQVLVLEQVRRLAAQGMTVVLSTHHPDQAFQVATRVATLKDGAMLRSGRPDEVITADGLEALYGVPVDVVTVDGAHGQRVCVPAVGRAGERA